MTNKPMLSVELRVFLERVVKGAPGSTWAALDDDRLAATEELRALLDEPDEPFNLQGWSIDHSAGRPILMHNKCSVIEAEQAYGLLNLIETAAQHQNSNPGWPDPLESTLAKEIINNPSAFDMAIRDLFDKLCREIQAGRYYRRFSGSEPMEFTANQGEPVAWVDCSPAWLKAGGDCATAPRICVGREGISHLHPAHSSAEQPAPVSADIVHDRAYRDGLKRGFSLGENGRIDQYQKEFDSYQREILQESKGNAAPVADHTQCEECKGWGYHENHHEGGGTECGECGGSGNATVAVALDTSALLGLLVSEISVDDRGFYHLSGIHPNNFKRALEASGAKLTSEVKSHKSPVAVVMPDVDELAQIIRNVDGSHTLGAGSLAEAILEEVARLNGVKP